jgi:hypothetical protein
MLKCESSNAYNASLNHAYNASPHHAYNVSPHHAYNASPRHLISFLPSLRAFAACYSFLFYLQILNFDGRQFGSLNFVFLSNLRGGGCSHEIRIFP